MTVLRLVPAAGRDVARVLASCEGAVLARRDGTPYVEVPVATVPRLVRALAFAGIAAVPCDADLAAPPGAHVAIGIGLSPLPRGLVALDVVRVVRMPLGRATREVFRRRFLGLMPPGPAARLRCRALLRGDDVMLAWSRRAWGSRAALRSARARGVLRPVVFDREAAERDDLHGRTSSRDERLALWLFS